MTEQAKQHHIAQLEHRLKGHRAEVHAARSEADRRLALDRVAECERAIELWRDDKVQLGAR
jgi:hypothetical protein